MSTIKKESLLRIDRFCRICKSKRIEEVLKLKDSPFEDQFLSKTQLKAKQPSYPLEVYLCKDCGYVFPFTYSSLIFPSEAYRSEGFPLSLTEIFDLGDNGT